MHKPRSESLVTNERRLGKRLPNEKHQQTSLINLSLVYLVFNNTTWCQKCSFNSERTKEASRCRKNIKITSFSEKRI